MIRYLWLFHYPAGVSVEEGEKWYLGTHTQEVKKLPGIKKYLTYKVINPPERPTRFVRATELWWADIESWRKAQQHRGGITAAPYTAPGLDPNLGLIVETAFVDETPEYDLMSQIPKI